MLFLQLSESRGEIVILLFPQWVSVPDKTIYSTATLQNSKSTALTDCHLCLNTLCSQLWFSKGFQFQKEFFFFLFLLLLPPAMMQVGHSCQSAAAKEPVTLTHLFVYACLSTCRPPVLSQVLPRAHSASQGSVVAVHRMQDLQQLSGSRKECGEWMSE